MGIFDSIGNTLFGGTKQVSTLNAGQQALMDQQSGLLQQYNPQSYSTLSQLAYNPQSSYQYDADNGAAAFKSGVYDPAMQQLNRQLANTNQSQMLHSSANQYAQNQLIQGTNNNLNNLQYQNNLQQQQMKQQAQDQAYGRQQSALAQMLGGNQSVYGTQATALQKTPGLLDGLSAIGGIAQGVGSMMGGMGSMNYANAYKNANPGYQNPTVG
jgi:hypothetical protein